MRKVNITKKRGEEGPVPDWVEHAVWWHLYPLGFTGAPIRPGEGPAGEGLGDHGPGDHGPGDHGPGDYGGAHHGAVVHRLRRVEDWLGYAVDLGVSGLALGPVFASESHGYDTVDHFRIDPRLGDEGDFDRLVGAAHQRGLRILLDGVFNHVGRGFPAFTTVLEQGPGASTAAWFDLSWPAGSGPGTEPGYRTFEGHPSLVALNHDEPAVAGYVARVMTHWLARGADGWRLDAAYAIPPAFWTSVLPRVRAAHPGAYLVGEVIQGDYTRIVAESGMDAVTQYELWKAIWSSLNDGNFFELAWALDRHNGFLDTFAPYTFVGNHDVTRLASQLVNESHLPLALAILLTVGGTPAIYAGDEQAFRGVKQDRPGGDDAVRPEFPASPAELAPHGWPTYRLHQQLIGLRRRHPWLHGARTSVLHLASTVFAYAAEHGGQRLITALNAGDAPADLPVTGATGIRAGTGDLRQPGTPEAVIALPGHSWAILG